MTENDGVTSLKRCEACGAEFGCGAGSETCWCFDVETRPQVLEKIAASYGDCLCSKCLRTMAAATADN